MRGGVGPGPFWSGRESLNVSGGVLAEKESLGLSLTGGAASGGWGPRGLFASAEESLQIVPRANPREAKVNGRWR